MTNLLVTFIASGIFSGLVATIVSLYFERRQTAKQRKLDCLRRVAGYRAVPPTAQWMETLNEIFITFNDAKPVIDSLRKFEGHIRLSGGHRNEDLLELIKAMMANLRLDQRNLDDVFLLSPLGVAKQPGGEPT